MTPTTVTTAQAAFLLGLHPNSLHRWAARHGIHPTKRERRGRSTVTTWNLAALRAASAPT